MVITYCLTCNKKMQFKNPSQAHDYCSRECANKSRSAVKIKKFICETCKKEFYLYESQVRQRVENGGKIRFCSRECKRIKEKGGKLA